MMNQQLFDNCCNVFRNLGMRLDIDRFRAFMEQNERNGSDLTYEEFILNQFSSKVKAGETSFVPQEFGTRHIGT